MERFNLRKPFFSENAQGIIAANILEALKMKNFLQTKPQFKNGNIFYYDFYYTNIFEFNRRMRKIRLHKNTFKLFILIKWIEKLKKNQNLQHK